MRNGPFSRAGRHLDQALAPASESWWVPGPLRVHVRVWGAAVVGIPAAVPVGGESEFHSSHQGPWDGRLPGCKHLGPEKVPAAGGLHTDGRRAISLRMVVHIVSRSEFAEDTRAVFQSTEKVGWAG